MHEPSADNDLLIYVLSVRRSPVAPDLASLSEPARSTRLSLLSDLLPPPPGGFCISMYTVSTRWLRLECACTLVAPVARVS